MARRLHAMGVEKYTNGFELTIHEDALNIPYTWKSPKIVFVNSMSDLFHKDVPFSFIKKVFDVMNDNPQHVFQVLTKRGDLLRKYSSDLKWGHNIWMGVSVENEKVIHRIDDLRSSAARIKFLSCEPLIGPIASLNLSGIDWMIVGGESGRNPREMKEDWVLDLLEQCKHANVKFFFKQWGGTNKKKTGRVLLDKTWDEMPYSQSLTTFA
jgi:protein gp37